MRTVYRFYVKIGRVRYRCVFVVYSFFFTYTIMIIHRKAFDTRDYISQHAISRRLFLKR